MSAKLNALTSDSYTDISQYRDQHFKVSTFPLLSKPFPQPVSPESLLFVTILSWDDVVVSFRQEPLAIVHVSISRVLSFKESCNLISLFERKLFGDSL